MIKYSLQCSSNHPFEGWFKSSADFDRQARRKLVACPVCGETRVSKAIMAPNVATRSKRRLPERTPEPAPGEQAPPPSPPAEMQRVAMPKELAAMMRKLRSEIERTSEYVGPRFAEEARKIHYQESEARGIYGEASSDEVRSLHEEGVEIYPIPALPEDHN